MKAHIRYVYIFSLLALAVSCSPEPAQEGEEGFVVGSAEIIFDESIYRFFTPVIQQFDSSKKEAEVRIKPMPSLEAVQQLLSGGTRGIVLARTFLPQEQEIMKQYNFEEPKPVAIAKDALVFFVRKDFPLDTINLEQLKSILTKEKTTFRQYFPQLTTEPTVVCADTRSSEYAQLLTQLTGNAAPTYPIQLLTNSDSVFYSVNENENTIGIGFLSAIATDTTLKSLKIGFTDVGGNYRPPVTVHQSHIVMGTYPLLVQIVGYFTDKRRYNLPEGFITYLSREKSALQYYLTQGIVPENTKFTLRPPE